MTTPRHRLQRGRPPGPADQVRSHRLVTFVTEGEYETMTQLAEQEHCSISAAAHQLLRRSLNDLSHNKNNPKP